GHIDLGRCRTRRAQAERCDSGDYSYDAHDDETPARASPSLRRMKNHLLSLLGCDLNRAAACRGSPSGGILWLCVPEGYVGGADFLPTVNWQPHRRCKTGVAFSPFLA